MLVKVKEGYDGAQLNSYLFSKGIILTHLNTRKKSLENYFLELLAEK